MDDTVNSILNLSNKDENNLDFGFVKNLLRCVLLECYPTLNWKPNGVFAEDSMNSPFSLVVKSAVKMCLESSRENIRDDFELDFPCRDSISNRGLLDHLLCFKLVYEKHPFYNASFLEFLCRCSEYTMLSYWYGIQSAPQMTLQVICIMMREMRESGKITANFWKDFEDFCEIYVQDEKRKRKLSKPKRRWKKMFCAI
ncbi:hypothetical protein AVEN_70233-1 [Araneus ventricosus]|uniref:Uncharacterized protein n=1 Tax=Araneus ventricosus TaxID=182803 RepID=A0A4Y2GCZ6_ARAVE|nr:hypothetical protein AVEN_70233-1 [Araneus ventricosus]